MTAVNAGNLGLFIDCLELEQAIILNIVAFIHYIRCELLSCSNCFNKRLWITLLKPHQMTCFVTDAPFALKRDWIADGPQALWGY